MGRPRAVILLTIVGLFALCWAVGILVDLPTAVVCERGRADVDATPTIQGGRFEERRLGPCVFYNPESRLPGSD